MKQRIVVVEEEGGIMLPNGEETIYLWVTGTREVECEPIRIRTSQGVREVGDGSAIWNVVKI